MDEGTLDVRFKGHELVARGSPHLEACLAALEKTIVLQKVHKSPVYYLLEKLTKATCQSVCM